MTIQKAYWVYCDGTKEDGHPCEEQACYGHGGVASVKEVHRVAKQEGWKIGKYDFCDRCVERKAEVHPNAK